MVPISLPLKPRILVAPLDWGLGHATRCIPIIRKLLAAGVDVVLAGEDKTAALLSAEFPQLPLLPLKGYRVRYGKTGVELIAKLLLQLPALLSRIDEEHKWLNHAIAAHHIDAVISDNRYGLYNKQIPSVILTHQLLIKSGFGAKADRLLQKLHYRYLQTFTQCWVPDAKATPSLAGDLSHPTIFPTIPVRYIDSLSRFSYKASSAEKHLLILLSGPEPQRSLWEQQLLSQLAYYKQPVVLVRGLPGNAEQLHVALNVTVYNHLPAASLETCLNEASFVIARTGYSTVMDMVALRKRSILIPTPGQTEQQYLATHLQKEGIALCLSQSKFRLLNALELAASFPYRFPILLSGEALEKAIADLVKAISKPVTPMNNR